jgi:hypothetical protein
MEDSMTEKKRLTDAQLQNVEEINESEIDIYDPETEDEFDELDFDEEGNRTAYDEDEDENEQDNDEDEDSSEEPEDDSDDDDEELEQTADADEEQETVKGKKKLPPSEIKVINLKKENAKLAREKAELQKQISQRLIDNEKSELKQKYETMGYDEDTAEVYAQNEVRMKQLEERQALMDFKEENEEVFIKYPEAKKDISLIMKNSKLTGMSTEQICRGMYGTANNVPTRDSRAIDSFSRKAEDKTDRASNAIKNANSQSEVRLSPQEIKYKTLLEKKFNNGEKLSNEEFKKYIR